MNTHSYAARHWSNTIRAQANRPPMQPTPDEKKGTCIFCRRVFNANYLKNMHLKTCPERATGERSSATMEISPLKSQGSHSQSIDSNEEELSDSGVVLPEDDDAVDSTLIPADAETSALVEAAESKSSKSAPLSDLPEDTMKEDGESNATFTPAEEAEAVTPAGLWDLIDFDNPLETSTAAEAEDDTPAGLPDSSDLGDPYAVDLTWDLMDFDDPYETSTPAEEDAVTPSEVTSLPASGYAFVSELAKDDPVYGLNNQGGT